MEENLKSHLRVRVFMVLKGAMNLLEEPCEMMFHADFQLTQGEET